MNATSVTTDNFDDEDKPANEELIECSMCHRNVPLKDTVKIGGRCLCYGCLGAWYEYEDEDEE